MKDSYLRYYEKYSGRAMWRFKWDSFFSRSPTERDGFANRRADYTALEGNNKLRELHLELNRVLLEQTNDWTSHDYGEGYFYQGLDEISIRGLRDTTARVSALSMSELVRGRMVLDIGSNTGFVSIALAQTAKSVEGIESNPYLNRIGSLSADYLGLENVTFNDMSFENFEPAETYGVVCSFANHSTFDGNTQHTVEEYFDKCHSLLDIDGLFLFESHAPAYEGDRLESVLGLIRERFSIITRTTLTTGKRFDDGRTLLVASPIQLC
jgi:SAM-dependent methyltransferase